MKHTFFRFLMVGVINTVVGLSSMTLLFHGAGLSYWISTFIGNAIGACMSYLLNRRFTFNSAAPVGKSIFRFITVIVICYIISYYMGIKLVLWTTMMLPIIPKNHDADVAILLGTAIYTVLNYLGQKSFVFKEVVQKGTK